MDHGECDRKRPIVHLLVEDVFVVDDDGEAQEDPDRDVGVGEEDLLDDSIAKCTAFSHCLGGGGERRRTVVRRIASSEGCRIKCAVCVLCF